MKHFTLTHAALPFLLLSVFIMAPKNGQAQLTVDSLEKNFIIDFDNTLSGVNNGQYTGAGFAPAPSTGQLDAGAWATTGMSDGNSDFGDTETAGDFAIGSSSGGVGTGGFYAFEVSTDDYAFGVQPTGTDFNGGNITLRILNSTGSRIDSFDIAYDIYVYNDQGRSNYWELAHSEDNGNYHRESTLDYNSPESADSLPEWQPVSRSITITNISVANNAYFYIRWLTDNFSGGGSRDEFGLDNISITAYGNIITGTSLLEAGAGTLADKLSSLESTHNPSILNFDFKVTDDGDTSSTDALPLILEAIQIEQGPANEISDWTAAIKGAKLSDGTNHFDATAINAGNIQFSGIDTAQSQLGHIADDSAKTYQLSIWLKSEFEGDLPDSIDGKIFDFEVSEKSFSLPSAGSSGLLPSQSINSGAGQNEVDVVATEIHFTKVPFIIAINVDFGVEIKATDVNGNLDRDEQSSVTLERATGTGSLSRGTGLAENLINGIYSWSNLLYDSVEIFSITTQSDSLNNATSTDIEAVNLLYTVFDDFDRSNTNTVGIPSSGGSQAWEEIECDTFNGRIGIEGSALFLSNSIDTGKGCESCSTAPEILSYDMSGEYATQFHQAEHLLVWAFNIKQPRNNPSGFRGNNYGAAVVLGCDEEDFNSSSADGYAVVMGNTGEDPWRLVHFSGGLSSLGTGQATDIASVPTAGVEDNYWSIKVTYDPCGGSGHWNLAARDDGQSDFNDPVTVNATPSIGSNNLHSLKDLKYFGAAWYHATACDQKMLVDNISIPGAIDIGQSTYAWIGATGHDYQDPDNWSPARTCIRLSDILLFNSGGNDSMVNVPTQTLAQFRIDDNTRVVLCNTSGKLTLNGRNDTALYVSSGSSLIIDSDNALEIEISQGANAFLEDSVIFRNSDGTGRAHRIQGLDSASVIFKHGSVFFAQSLSGSPFGNTGQVNTTIFEDGATYISEAGGNPFSLSQPSSKVVFHSNSLYRHQQSGNRLSLSGRTYGNVEINFIVNSTSGSKGNKVVMQDITLKSGAEWNLIFALLSDSALDIEILGDLTIEAGASISFDPKDTSYLIFAGTGEQVVSGDSAITFGDNAGVRINNQDRVRIEQDWELNGFFDLANGIADIGSHGISLGPDILLTGGDLTTYFATSETGMLRREIADTTAHHFPIGHNPYLPIVIECEDCDGGEAISAHVEDGINSQPDGNGNDETNMTVLKTWVIETPPGTDSNTYTITVQWNNTDQEPNPGESNATNYVGFGYGLSTDTEWNKQEISPADNPASGIYAKTLSGIRLAPGETYVFGIGDTTSPVPVELISFTGRLQQDDVLLEWKTASELNNSHFVIERSADAQTFEAIDRVPGAGTTAQPRSYSYLDLAPKGEVLYYRLLQADFDGQVEYSPVVVISRSGEERASLTVLANPVRSQLQVNVQLSDDSQVRMQLVDMTGRQRLTRMINLNKGKHLLNINMDDLPAGFYLFNAEMDGKIYSHKIFKLN